ncbi:helix-turn-helix domain-containing protein [Gibbsiella quercinecans]|nr:helix-turn-helix domain-containing protein [Gibbsiella quercinecans]
MQRLQFVTACLKGDTSVAELCRRFNISRKTGYKWLSRYACLRYFGAKTM